MTCKYGNCQTSRPLNSTYELRLGWHIPCLNHKHKKDRYGWQRTDAGTKHEGNGGSHTRGDARKKAKK